MQRLRKFLYRGTDPPRWCYGSVLVLMRPLSVARSTVDHAHFARHEAGVLALAIAVHVDVFFFGGSPTAVDMFESALRSRFAAGPTKVGAFMFTWLSLASHLSDSSGVPTLTVKQDACIGAIEELVLTEEHLSALSSQLKAAQLTLSRRVSHKMPCHPSPQKQIGTTAQLR